MGTRRVGWGRVLAAMVMAAGGATGACEGPPAGPAGSLSGRVTLKDEVGGVLADASGVTVRLTGASAFYSTTTGEDGRFTFRDLPEDATWDLVAERGGFGLVRAFAVETGSEPLDLSMGARSTAEVSTLDATVDPECGGDPCLDLEFRARNVFPQVPGRRLFLLFVGSDSDVSPFHYDNAVVLVVPSDDPGVSTVDDDVRVELASVRGILGDRFSPGTRVWLRLHGATENLAPAYTDPETGLEVFTSVSALWASTVVTMP